MGGLAKRVVALEQKAGNPTDMAARLNRLTDAELERVEAIIMALGPATEEALAAMPPDDLQFLFAVGLLTEIPDGHA